MARNRMAGQDRGPRPIGEKCPRTGHKSGSKVAHTVLPCGLCALWRRPANPPATDQASRVTPHGLRIALVDDDAGTCLVARQMVQAQRDGWSLEVHHPSCPARKAAGREGASHPTAPGQDHGPGSTPDIVLVGLSGQKDARLACVKKLKALAPDLPVLIISDDRDEASIAERCAAGADGYLLKPLAPDELARAVLSVAQGWPVLSPEAQKAILNVFHRSAMATTAWFPGLTGREQEMAGCLVASLHDKEISTRLGMAEATVHAHLTRVYRKLGVHNRRQAVAKLLGLGGGASSPF